MERSSGSPEVKIGFIDGSVVTRHPRPGKQNTSRGDCPETTAPHVRRPTAPRACDGTAFESQESLPKTASE